MSGDAGGSLVRSRGELLTAAGTALAAIVIEGCGGSDSTKLQLRTAPPLARRADVELLNHLLDLENRTAAAYSAGIPLLDGGAARNAEQFLGQELSHAGELAGLVKEAGGKPLKQRPSYDLGSPRSGRDVLALLHELERLQITAYLDAIARLQPGSVRAAVATVLANDAQHLSFIRGALHLNPLPQALVTGTQ